MKNVTVTTAVKMSADNRKRVEDLLVEQFGLSAQKFKLQERINAKVVAGLKLNIEGQVYDDTLQKKLAKLQE